MRVRTAELERKERVVEEQAVAKESLISVQTTVTPVERLTRFHVMRSDVVALRRALRRLRRGEVGSE